MIDGRRSAARWLSAVKPASWPKLLVPFVLGQAIGLSGARAPSLTAAAIGLAFTVCDLVFIVLLNDWGDREVDAIKRRMFPRSSPKTVPDGILPAHHLLLVGAVAGLAAASLGFAGQLWLARPWLGALGVLALGIFVAYTLPPLRLNYRGGGELLEMLGVGVALPWLNAYLQGGDPLAPGLWLLPGFALFGLASAVASGLSDERSDRRGGKRTFVTRFGNRAGRRAAEALAFGGVSAWVLSGVLGDALPWWVTVPPAAVALAYLAAAVRVSGAATTDAFDAQRRYKTLLHRAIWRGALTASIFLGWWQLW